MVKLIACDGAGNTIVQHHATMDAACMAADILHAEGFREIDMREEELKWKKHLPPLRWR